MTPARRRVLKRAALDVAGASVLAARLVAGHALLVGYGVGILASRRIERIRWAIEGRR